MHSCMLTVAHSAAGRAARVAVDASSCRFATDLAKREAANSRDS